MPLKIQGAKFAANRAEAASDMSTATYTVGTQTITFSLVGTTTSVSGLLEVYGKD